MSRAPATAAEAVVYIAASADGYIARADGRLDWLPAPPEGEDYGYAAFVASVDTIVLGRVTYEAVLGFGIEWPYAGLRAVVLSSGTPDVPEALADVVEVRRGEPATVLRDLGASGTRRAWIDGGATVQRFVRAGCVAEMTVTRVPVLLGGGVPLFGALRTDVPLVHAETHAFADGCVQTRYRVG